MKNKKFHDIALQVGGSHYPDVGGELLEKFAELIVKECLTICEDVTERNEPAIACYYEIKQQFGVK